jgi:drug/metabolite transporter (DMT)-like permease
MAAVLLALASAVLFGALAVAIRLATRRGADPETGALATTAISLVACGSAALVVGGETDDLWPFVHATLRPDSFRRVGVGLALAASALFATRDNVIRELQVDSEVEPLAAAAATLVGGGLVIVAYLLAARRDRVLEGMVLHVWLPSGLLFAASYAALFEAYDRGRVTVVSPLVATESLWGVVLAALVLRRSEMIGRRLVAGALLIVAGSALIGVTR